MKAKKLMGMIACAGACVSLSAFANTTNGWFGVSVNTDIETANCTTNGAAVQVDDSKIILDNDLESALTITPKSGTAVLSDGLVTITSTALLTPSDASELGAITGGAQAGFAVAVNSDNQTNFYGYASAGGEGGAPDWIKFTTGPANPEADTTFTIAINYRDKKVSFYNGTTLLVDAESHSEFSISNNFVNLSNIAAYGSGSISSVTSQYEVAVAAVQGGSKYGSAAEAVVAAGTSGTVLDIDPTTGEATTEKQATNGLYAWQCDVLGIEPDASIPLEPATKEVASDKIAVAVSGYTPVDGVSVKFQVKRGESLVSNDKYDADAIGIPLTTGTYTVVPEIKATANP